jgi:hypothetical protein
MCLLENNRKFELLNFYRGVQFVCQAELDSVLEDRAFFTVQPHPSVVLLEREKTAIVLSNGSLDPFILRVESFDYATGKLEACDMVYTGDIVGKRREHRVETDPSVPVELEMDGRLISGVLADISLGGAGIRIPPAEDCAEFKRGKTVVLHLHLPEGDINLSATALRCRKSFTGQWLAMEFSSSAPGKDAILRYINRHLAEVRQEVQKMYEKAYQPKAG